MRYNPEHRGGPVVLLRRGTRRAVPPCRRATAAAPTPGSPSRPRCAPWCRARSRTPERPRSYSPRSRGGRSPGATCAKGKRTFSGGHVGTLPPGVPVAGSLAALDSARPRAGLPVPHRERPRRARARVRPSAPRLLTAAAAEPRGPARAPSAGSSWRRRAPPRPGSAAAPGATARAKLERLEEAGALGAGRGPAAAARSR